MRTKSLVAAAGISAAVLLAGCGGGSSDAGSGDGGSGKATTTAAPGDSSDAGGDVTVPGDVEIPAGFPEAFTPPDGTTVTEATTAGAAGTSFFVKVTVEGDSKDAYEAYKAQVADAGYEVLGAQFTPSDQGGYGGFSAKGDDYTAAVTFGPDPTGSYSTLQINVAPVS